MSVKTICEKAGLSGDLGVTAHNTFAEKSASAGASSEAAGAFAASSVSMSPRIFSVRAMMDFLVIRLESP